MSKKDKIKKIKKLREGEHRDFSKEILYLVGNNKM